MRYVLATFLVLTLGCSVTTGGEDEDETIDRAGIRFLNGIADAPPLSVTVTVDTNVPDITNLRPGELSRYIGIDAGGFTLRVGATDGTTRPSDLFNPIPTVSGQGAQDRWLIVFSGTMAAPKYAAYVERRNDGHFVANDAVGPVPVGSSQLRLINATRADALVSLNAETPPVAIADVAIDALGQATVIADTAFDATLTTPAGAWPLTIPALPSALDVSLVVLSDPLRTVLFPAQQGASVTQPVALETSAVIVNAFGTARTFTVGGTAYTLEPGAQTARAFVPSTFVATSDADTSDPIALGAGAYTIVLAPEADGTGLTAFAYSSGSGTRAVNAVIDAEALAVTVASGTSLGTAIAYGAAGPAVTLAADGSGITATAGAQSFTEAIAIPATTVLVVVSGDVAGTVRFTLVAR